MISNIYECSLVSNFNKTYLFHDLWLPKFRLWRLFYCSHTTYHLLYNKKIKKIILLIINCLNSIFYKMRIYSQPLSACLLDS